VESIDERDNSLEARVNERDDGTNPT
jgi:hypothetical protein